MISYSIDPTTFIPPELPEKLPEDKTQAAQIKRNIYNYKTTIDKCYNLLIHQDNISVYLFWGKKNNIDSYMKKASKFSGFPMDVVKQRLEDIFELRFAEKECHFGININKHKNKYIFNDWFEIKDIVNSDCILTPSLNELITQDKELEGRLIKIGILNQFAYKSPDFHFLILNNDNLPVQIESNIKYLKCLNEPIKDQLLKTQVQTKKIDNITVEPEKFKTVLEAYEAAKNQFANYLIFGNDVNAGIKTIRDYAGPPDRIFTYLETLKDFCIYKRNYNTPYDDADVLKMFGCICSHEKPEHLRNQKVIDDRNFDDGSNNRNSFELHLKPNTFDPASGKSRTVRIYFKWDEKQQKVIIGWIGDHRYLPEKND